MAEQDNNHQKHPDIVGPIIKTALTGALLTIASCAFSRRTQKEIIANANGCSEVTGQEGKWECSHIDHSKENPKYDTAENGVYMEPVFHLLYHFIFRHCPEAIGLTEDNNNRAIQATKSRADINCGQLAEIDFQYGRMLRDIIKRRCLDAGQPNPFDLLDRTKQEMAAD